MLGIASSAPLQGDVDREAQRGGRREYGAPVTSGLCSISYQLAPFGSGGCHGLGEVLLLCAALRPPLPRSWKDGEDVKTCRRLQLGDSGGGGGGDGRGVTIYYQEPRPAKRHPADLMIGLCCS